jgi:hypothetical protein
VTFFGFSARTPYPGRDVLLTGIPRSGTTLCCHLLDKIADVLALHEPMDTGRLFATADGAAVRKVVRKFLSRTRRSALEHGVARTKHVDGKVPDNVVANEVDESGERRRVNSKGPIEIGRPLRRDFTLVVKHNGLFTAVLPELVGRFEVYGVVRNPLAVLSSWNSVPLELRSGRAAGTERLAPGLAAALDRLDDVTARQVHVVNWYFERYSRFLDPVRVLRYEDLVATRGRSLALVVPAAARLNGPLECRNANRLYDRDTMRRLGERLLADDGAWRRFYSPRDVESLLASAEVAAPVGQS